MIAGGPAIGAVGHKAVTPELAPPVVTGWDRPTTSYANSRRFWSFVGADEPE
jgi:hypothetical protein